MASVTQQFRQQIDDLPLEEVPCYLCGREDGVTLVDDPPFVVKLCAGCGLGYTSPRLCGDRIHELYDDGYFNSDRAEAFGYDDYHKDIQAYLKTFRRKLKALGPHLAAGSSVLEVGCAGGAFLKVMHDRGHEGWGIELATGMVDSVKSKFGFENVFCGKFDEVFDRHFVLRVHEPMIHVFHSVVVAAHELVNQVRTLIVRLPLPRPAS